MWLLSLEKIGKEIAYKDYIPNVILVDDDEEEEEDISNAENYIWDGEDEYEEDDSDLVF